MTFPKKNANLTLVFRNPGSRGMAIERLFQSMVPHLQKEFNVDSISAAEPSNKPAEVYKNIKWLKKFTESVLQDDPFHVFHVTGDVHYMMLGIPQGRGILTIHDAHLLDEPNRVKRLWYKKVWFEKPIRRAARVTVVSDVVRQRICEEFPWASAKIEVIPNCRPDTDLSHSQVGEKPDLGNEFRILMIGHKPNKNAELGFEAIKKLLADLKDSEQVIHLFWVAWPTAEQTKDLTEMQLAFPNLKVSQESGIDDARLEFLYQSSNLLLYPSKKEGFGLPILEAQTYGVPVITSNRAPLKTISGDGAVHVDPEDVNSIYKALKAMVSSEDASEILRDIIIQNGHENVKKYAPEVIAAHLAEVYARVMNL